MRCCKWRGLCFIDPRTKPCLFQSQKPKEKTLAHDENLLWHSGTGRTDKPLRENTYKSPPSPETRLCQTSGGPVISHGLPMELGHQFILMTHLLIRGTGMNSGVFEEIVFSSGSIKCCKNNKMAHCGRWIRIHSQTQLKKTCSDQEIQCSSVD